MVSPFACGAYGLRMSDLIPPQDAHWPKAAIFTVGHSTLPIERFVELLKIYGIEQLVDIRTMPGSRHNPQFGLEALAGSLKAAHVEYQAYVYPGVQHGFNNDTTPRYDEKAANLAWRRSIDFLQERLKA